MLRTISDLIDSNCVHFFYKCFTPFHLLPSCVIPPIAMLSANSGPLTSKSDAMSLSTSDLSAHYLSFLITSALVSCCHPAPLFSILFYSTRMWFEHLAFFALRLCISLDGNPVSNDPSFGLLASLLRCSVNLYGFTLTCFVSFSCTLWLAFLSYSILTSLRLWYFSLLPSCCGALLYSSRLCSIRWCLGFLVLCRSLGGSPASQTFLHIVRCYVLLLLVSPSMLGSVYCCFLLNSYHFTLPCFKWLFSNLLRRLYW